jgi:Zn-dependent alcohol dehydrogenase
VVKIGSAVKNAAPGDKVLLSYNFCGDCDTCKSGHPAYCDTWTPLNFGCSRADGTLSLADEKGADVHCNFFGQSSFGQHAVVAASSMVKVSPETDLKLYAPLGCGLQTGAGAVINSLGTTKGSSLAVWGVGPVGLAAVMAGKIVGAKTIIAIDLQQDRLDLAQELGATHVIDGKARDVVEQVQKLSGANGVNFAVDCTGVPKVVENMVNSLGTRGRGCTVGAPKPGSTAAMDIFSHLMFGREYIGCVEGDADPPKVDTDSLSDLLLANVSTDGPVSDRAAQSRQVCDREDDQVLRCEGFPDGI